VDRDRPSYFYENLLGSRAAVIEGRLPMALPVPLDAIRQRSTDLRRHVRLPSRRGLQD
jgi:hypothetical protein